MLSRAAPLCLALLAAAPLPAAARPWNGITPGASTAAEVTRRFGEPSTKGKLGGRTALVYKGDQAIEGTRQAQFFTREDGKVVEITVFPTVALDKDAVEGTYGKGAQKIFTDDFRPVWIYRATGVTVFFTREGPVEAITFRPGEAAPASNASSRAESPAP